MEKGKVLKFRLSIQNDAEGRANNRYSMLPVGRLK